MKMNFSWKRFLSMVLAIVMVVGLIPFGALDVYAAEETYELGAEATTPNEVAPADQPNAVWVANGDNAGFLEECAQGYRYEHTHDDTCYKLDCDHKDGHWKDCFATTTAYAECKHSEDSQHSGYVDIWDLLKLDLSDRNEPIKFKDHEASPIAKAKYDDLFNNGGCNKKHFFMECKGINAILNHYQVITGMKICYTVAEGEEPICGHVHSEVGGSCYTLNSLTCGVLTLGKYEEHTHKKTDDLNTSCYRYDWILKADINNNNVADDADTYYTVKFVDGETELASYSVLTQMPTPAAPEVAGKEHYTFRGWDKAFAEKVTADATYTAQWTPVNYTITWVNGNETTTTEVAYGTKPQAPDAVKDPKKDAEGNVIETYVGSWPTLEEVSGPTTYTANFTAVTAEYTVTFVNYDDTVLQTGNVPYGAMPEYTGETPAKPADDEGEYEFSYWTPEIDTVKKAITYKAVFAVEGYIVQNKDTEEMFVDMQEAIDAANPGETIALLEDVIITSTLRIKNKDVIILDLNGKTLSTPAPVDNGDGTFGDDSSVMVILNHGTLTVKDTVGTGAIISRDCYIDANGKVSKQGHGIQNQASSKLIIDGAVIKAENTGRAIYTSGGTVTIKANTTIIGGNDAFYLSGDTVAVVEGGSFTASESIFELNSNERGYPILTIKNGEFDLTDNTTLALDINNLGDIQIHGGTFGFDPSGYIPAEYIADHSDDATENGRWTVRARDFYTVTFVLGNGEDAIVYSVMEGDSFTTPADPTYEYHLFQGWDKTVVTTPTENATYNAVWAIDNDKDGFIDGSENDPFWTIRTEQADGTYAEETVLNGAEYNETPAEIDKANAIFVKWIRTQDDEALTVTYSVEWNNNDANDNNVDDGEETITVEIVGEGTVTVNGKPFNGGAYVYNSKGDKVITIVATPVVGDNNISTSFVAGVEGVEGTGAYGNGYAYTYTFTAEDGNAVTVNFAEAKFERDEDGKMRFYVGMEDPDYETLYSSVIKAPAYSAEAVGKNVKYLARTEGEYELDLSRIRELLAEIKYVGSIAVRLFDSAYPDAKTSITLEEKWLNVGDKLDEGDIDEVLEEAINAGIEEIKALIADGDYLKAISAIGELGTKVTDKIGTIGCHAFGENTLTDAEGNVQEIISVDYQSAEMHLTDDTLVVTLVDDRIETVINTEEVSVVYRDYTAESLVEAIAPALVDINGNSVAGDVVLTSKVKGTEIVGTFEVTFEYKGSYEYKPATKTVTVTVEKAPASIDIPNVQVNYNEGYSVAPKVTLGNQYGDPTELTNSMIQFVVGLDIAQFDYDEDGVKGLNGKIQLILPEDIQGMLDGILGLTGGNVEAGIEMSLSDLLSYLDILGDETTGTLSQALEAIMSVVEAGDLTITLGGDLPKNAGAYLYGAVTTSPNYETAFDVAYIVIAPELKEVYLDWNYSDSNGVFTWELLKHVDLGATAYADPAFTNVDADATNVMQNLFFGINTDGDLVVKLHGKHSELEALEASLGNGAYTQLAFTLDIGNKLVYAKPIVRAFVLVPNIANVQLVDAEGNALDTFNFTFDNAPKQLFVMVDGELVECDITYTGIQTNLNVYEPTTEAPKHAGAYGAVVTYVGTDENGEIISVGIDAAVIDIAPAQSALEVTGGEFEHDGQAHGVTVNTNADVTMISGTVSFDAGGDGLGIEDVHGIVNVDFPKWVDKILSEKFANAYEYGVSTKSFLFKLQQHEAAMLEMGITEEIINSLTNLMKNLPENVVVYFNDDPAYTEPGVYAFFGIVTDSDYIPSYDTGLVTIGKETTVVDMMNTTVIFNGQGQFVNVYNPDNNDYVTIIVDRENNIGNITFEDDLNALVTLIENALGYELPKSINVAELHNAVDKVLTAVEGVEVLSAEAVTILTQIRQVLAELPQSGVVYINGEWLPTNVGKYEFYGASYSLKFTTNLTEAVLTIVPAELIVELDDVTVHEGEEIPELTYTVNGLYGNDVVNVTASYVGNTITAEVEASENYKVTVVDGTLTIVPHTKSEPVVENFVDSSCSTEGSYDSVVYCSGCGVELSRKTVAVPVKEHTEGEPVVENHVAPDCENFGHYESVTYCSVCGEELSRYTVRIPALGHTDETIPAVDPTFDTVGWTAGVKCSVCGEILVAPVEIPKLIAVAQNVETGKRYEKLSDAISEVKNGETIVLLTTIDENVTIKQTSGKSFTIDGNEQTYTGTMSINGNKRPNGKETLTIQNVNFVAHKNMQVSIDTVKNTSVHNLTVEGCTFTGIEAAEKTAYGMILRNAYNVVVKDTEGTGLFDLVYGNRAVTGFIAEEIKVTESKNGIFLSNIQGTASFKNVETHVIDSGVGFFNNGNGTAVFEDCNIDKIDYEQLGTASMKLIFNDEQNNLRIYEGSAYDKLTIVLNKVDTTVTCDIDDLNAITTEELNKTHKVVYENGVYKLVERVWVAQIGDTKFESIQEAVNAAIDGDIVKVIADHEVACDVNPLVMVAGKDITIDLNGKIVTANVTETTTRFVFETAEDAKLTMTDSVGTGCVIANGEGILHYMFRNAGEMVIEGGNYKLAGLNGGAMFFSLNSNMTVTGGNFTQTTGGWMFNTNLNSVYVITVTGGTFNRYFIGGNTVTPEENTRGEVVVPEQYSVYDNHDGTWTVLPRIVVTFDDVTVAYGQTPEFTYTVETYGWSNYNLSVETPVVNAVNAGVYEDVIYADAYVANGYVVEVIPGTLTIEKAKVTVTMNDLTKFYGEADPNFTYTIETEYTGEFMLVVAQSRDAGEDIGSYAINPEAYIFMNDNFDVEVIPGALTIKPAEITITVQNNTVLAGTVTPDVVVNVEIVNGNVAEDTLNVQATWNAETVDGKLVHGEYANNAVTYTESNNWVVTVVDGTLTVELGDYVCWNPETAEYWDDLSDALEDADQLSEGAETIQMLTDFTEYYFIVATGTTLDLNGFTVTSRFAAAVDGAHIIDNTEGAGRLVVGMNSVTLDEQNKMLPVYDGNGYIFGTMLSGIKKSNKQPAEGVSIDALLAPSLPVVALLKDGAEDNNLKVVIRLTWDTDDGVKHQDFAFNDDVVAKVFASNKGTQSGYGLMFQMVITGIENVKNLRANVLFQSGTDAEIISNKTLPLN